MSSSDWEQYRAGKISFEELARRGEALRDALFDQVAKPILERAKREQARWDVSRRESERAYAADLRRAEEEKAWVMTWNRLHQSDDPKDNEKARRMYAQFHGER